MSRIDDLPTKRREKFSEAEVNVRWMIRRDVPQMLSIEQVCFDFPWDEEDFGYCLRTRNCIGMVAEVNDTLVGYMSYELHRDRLVLLNLAVVPNFERCGIGAILVNKLIGKLSAGGRNKIAVNVPETNVDAAFFFKRFGFRAVGLLRNYHPEKSEDAFAMIYSLETECSGVASRI